MDTVLAKYRRGWSLSLLLGLLLFGNELVHLHCHGHLHGPSGASALRIALKSDGASALSAERRHSPEVSAGEFSCPYCSSAIDLLCAPASAELPAEAPPVTAARRDPAPPVFHFTPHHQPRSSPLD